MLGDTILKVTTYKVAHFAIHFYLESADSFKQINVLIMLSFTLTSDFKVRTFNSVLPALPLLPFPFEQTLLMRKVGNVSLFLRHN